MITRIAVVPYPPLLVPRLTVRTGPETGKLRSACLRAVSSLTESADEWVAVAADRYGPRVLSPDALGTFSGYGVDVPVSLGEPAEAEPDPLLPLPALVAGWLREQAGAKAVTLHLLGTDWDAHQCREYGRTLARAEGKQGLLVLADGTNRRDERSPYPPDERAQHLDHTISTSLAGVDSEALGALDPGVAGELGIEGRAALQTLPGVLEGSGGRWRGELLYSAAPFGVGYHVALWAREDA